MRYFCLLKKGMRSFFRQVLIVYRHKRSVPKYSVEELNLASLSILIRVRKSVSTVRHKLTNIIYDSEIICGLSSVQAAWVGYYFGRLIGTKNIKLQISKKASYLLNCKGGNNKILFEDRDGKVGYFDRNLQKERVRRPIKIIKNQYVLQKFDSSQACYIGILAGIRSQAESNNDDNNNNLGSPKKPYLKIVS